MIMKKVLLALTIAATFAACTGKPKETAVLIDTTAIKQKAVLEEQAKAKAADDERNRLAAEKKSAEKNYVNSNRTVHHSSTVHHSGTSNRSNSGTNNSNVGTSASPSSNGSGTVYQEPKRGMSSAAKGAIIGGVGGAVAGGIIGHNAKGAIIGGAVGAGTGYVIGRSKDRKSGRVVKE